MKIIAATLLSILTVSAQAGITARIPTEAGGSIRLTDTPCKNTEGSAAYAVAPDGKIIGGCWGYDAEEGLAWVRYDGGEAYFYVLTPDMLTDYGRSKLAVPDDSKISM